MKNLIRTLLMGCLTTMAAAEASAQRVPEGIHSEAQGPIEMCGLKGEDVADLRAKAISSRFLRLTPIDSPRFELFVSSDDMNQLIFTRRTEAAYPAATCRHTFQVADGSWHQKRSMRCEASREDCDQLFLEFRDLDDRLAKSLSSPD